MRKPWPTRNCYAMERKGDSTVVSCVRLLYSATHYINLTAVKSSTLKKNGKKSGKICHVKEKHRLKIIQND
jgi:hypothetical protein